jgi:nucleotide-binding universal stress UspA family protein
MKDIIVAIDFAESSINSLEHAITIAERARWNLTMVWVNKHGTTSTMIDDKFNEQQSEVETRFQELVEKYKSRLPNNKLTYVIRNGKVHKEIVSLAHEIKAELIVCGTHGSSGFEQFLIGSNANKIVAFAPCPVITIRSGVNIARNLARIVLPVDSTLETRQKVPFTSRLAKWFDAEVHILGLYPSAVKAVQMLVDSYCDQVAKHFDEFEIKYVRTTQIADNPTKASLDYAQSIDANLITIMTAQETNMLSFFYGTYAQQMVNQSSIPVLSIHPRELMIMGSR